MFCNLQSTQQSKKKTPDVNDKHRYKKNSFFFTQEKQWRNACLEMTENDVFPQLEERSDVICR